MGISSQPDKDPFKNPPAATWSLSSPLQSEETKKSDEATLGRGSSLPKKSVQRFSLKDYLKLSKFRIVLSVLAGAFLGFFAGHSLALSVEWWQLLFTLSGLFFLASGASALNQYQERELDARMPRTAGRPLPAGRIGKPLAVFLILVNVSLGLVLLAQVNLPVLYLGLASVFFYNGLYTLWWKPHWAFAAIPGAIPGALPVLIGYAAASGNPWQGPAIYLFALMFFWQMPHFWVLALKYRDDYKKGQVPTLPVALGIGVTHKHITLWCLGYVAMALMAPLFFQVDVIYLPVSVLLGMKLLRCLRAFLKNPERKTWLRFFVWINISLPVYLLAVVLDLWSVYLLVPLLTGNSLFN